jgi:hypothetical protein
MIRFFAAAFAAAILTTGAVASLAAAPDGSEPTVRIDKAGKYCVTAPPVGSELVARTECRSVRSWASEGVTFSRR